MENLRLKKKIGESLRKINEEKFKNFKNEKISDKKIPS